MKRRRLYDTIIPLFLVACVIAPITPVEMASSSGGGVFIPDAALRVAIEMNLSRFGIKRKPGAPITPAEMAQLPWFDAPNMGIRSLTGLEHATKLQKLRLGFAVVNGRYVNSNDISDLSPLSNLTNLTELTLGGNSISDVSPLANLTNLEYLFLSNNNISDISPLANLTNLVRLKLGHNRISDISALSNLTNLLVLDLSDNSISDISALYNLRYPIILFLSDNSISDLAPLVANTRLSRNGGATVYVGKNPLSATSINMHIPALQGRGVRIIFR